MDSTLVIKDLKALADPAKADLLQRYFKTGKGQYGEGDKFIGITVPTQRKVAHKYIGMSLNEIRKLLESDIHEHRFTALEILNFKYEKTDQKEKAKIAAFYLKNRICLNNWDLVDTSAPYILGDWLVQNDRSILYELIKSKNVWDRRIAIVSTFAFIKNNDFEDSLKLAKLSLTDKHDLMHKATGWMLRELGKKSGKALEGFLDENYKTMPRTMLRYAIERMPKEKRKHYLMIRSS